MRITLLLAVCAAMSGCGDIIHALPNAPSPVASWRDDGHTVVKDSSDGLPHYPLHGPYTGIAVSITVDCAIGYSNVNNVCVKEMK